MNQQSLIGDPTENVKALTEAEALRQDDLRKASDKYSEAAINHIKEMVKLRSEYQEKLVLAEAKRIDAIRAVDVNAVAIASEKATAAAQILANSVTASAETLRNLVMTTASNIADQQKQIVDSLNIRISAVEKSQYEGQGKTSGTKDLTAIILAGSALLITIIFGILNYFNK